MSINHQLSNSFPKKIQTEKSRHIFPKVTKITTMAPLRSENSDVFMKWKIVEEVKLVLYILCRCWLFWRPAIYPVHALVAITDMYNVFWVKSIHHQYFPFLEKICPNLWKSLDRSQMKSLVIILHSKGVFMNFLIHLFCMP